MLPPCYVKAVRRASIALVLLAALPSLASAYEDKVVLTLDLGYGAALANDDLPTHGFAGGIGVDIGIDVRVDVDVRIDVRVESETPLVVGFDVLADGAERGKADKYAPNDEAAQINGQHGRKDGA